MRLFEIDQGSARDVLLVFKGLANRKDQSSELPFRTVLNLIKPFGLGISTPDGLISLKNDVDPDGNVIKDILDDGTVVLTTTASSGLTPKEPTKSSTPTVDQMASHAAKDLTPDI